MSSVAGIKPKRLKKLNEVLALAEATTSCVQFVRSVLTMPDGSPATPHPTQVEMLEGVRRFTVAACGRQWGKSVAVAWFVVYWCLTHKARQAFIIAPSLDQSRIIFNEIARHFRDNPLLRGQVVGKIIDSPFPRIKLRNGTEIHARGANSPQYIRGKTPHLCVLDEASFVKDRTITDVIRPSMNVTGKSTDSAFILISTPFGEGAFKDLYTEAEEEEERGSLRYAHFQFPSTANPYADEVELELVRRRYGEDSLLWRTEYLAQFAGDDLAVFPWAHIKWAYQHYPYQDKNVTPSDLLEYATDDPADHEADGTRPLFPQPPKRGHTYVQGADLADQFDYFVSIIADMTAVPDRATVVHMDRWNKRGWAEIKRTIRQNHHDWNQAETAIDATSYGASVTEDLRDIGVQGVKLYTNQAKTELVKELQRALAEHRLLIPYDARMIKELRYFSYKITPSKVLQMEAPGGGHDDIVIALALVAHLALIPHHVGFFEGFDTTVWTTSPEDVDGERSPFTGRVKLSTDAPYTVENPPPGKVAVLDPYDPFSWMEPEFTDAQETNDAETSFTSLLLR